jgi:outer membrane protein OmpA-like peptidoglycan-associated protein
VRLGTARQSPLVTGEDGTFHSGSLEPGKVELVITAAEFLEGRCEAILPAAPDASQNTAPGASQNAAPDAGQKTGGGDVTVEVTCALEPLAKLGGVLGSLYDAESGAVVGDAKLIVQDRAGRKLELVANPNGMFRLQNIPFGTMTLSVEAPGYLFAVWRVDVASREEVQRRFALHPRPKRATVTVTPKAIRVAKPVRFEPGTTRLLPGAEETLQELAEVLRARPDVKLVEIRGYMDETGAISEAMHNSRERAELIRGLLLDLGVEGERVVATGVLEDQPKAPGAKAGAGLQVTFAVLEFGRKR